MPTISTNIGMQDFFTTTLSAAVSDATDLTIYLNSVPTETEGYLVIDYSNSSKREIIFYNAVGANYVAVPADGRGQGSTTAQAHDLGADVRMNMVSGYFDVLKDGQLLGGQDWIQMSGSPAYASADSPTFTMTATGDITAKVYPGVRVKGSQVQALSHYWSFDSSSAADKGSATMGNIGTPTYTAGKFSNALTLNGTNQALSITDAAAFHLGASGAEFTIGAWFKTSNSGVQTIFSSFSKNPNYAGVVLKIDTGRPYILLANNTSSTGGYNEFMGTGAYADGNWHRIDASFKNNYIQVYVDGVMNISGYSVTPAYAATNYVRIGCTSDAGSNAGWFNGQIDDLFLINGYALDEQTIAAKYASATTQGTGDLTLTKYFLCTASSYSAPNTTITMYGGTDHSLVNATISNVYYSTQKAPYGFPLREEKWTVETSAPQTVSSAQAQGAWVNTGAGSIIVPVGNWNLGFYAVCDAGSPGATCTFITINAGLSTANNTAPDARWAGKVAAGGATSTTAEAEGTFYPQNPISLSAKRTYYLNLSQTNSAGNTANLRLTATPIAPRLFATSTLL